MRVILTDKAKASLQEITDYIARDNRRRAKTFTRELMIVTLKIGHTPHAFPFVPRFEQRGLRSRAQGSYRIFYIVKDNHVRIVNILHAARDQESIFSPDP